MSLYKQLATPYFKLPFYLLSAFVFSYFLGLSGQDDGLRHIAFAAHHNSMDSWGVVFPHSLFTREYDPWYAWHGIISLLLHFVPFHLVHYAINTLFLFILMLLLDALLQKYSKVSYKNYSFFLVLVIVTLASSRYINLRPDLLSGLFLMAALLVPQRFVLLFLLTLIYSSTYYLFFLYTGSLGLLFLITKNTKAFFAVFSASVVALAIHFFVGGEHFLQTVVSLLEDQSLRQGLEVSEGKPLFSFLGIFNYYILVAFVLLVDAFIIGKFYTYFIKQPLALLLLLMAPLWLAQIRYFLLLLPLFYLYFFVEMPTLLRVVLSRNLRLSVAKFVHNLKHIEKKPLLFLPLLLYTLVMLAYSMHIHDNTQHLKEKNYYTDAMLNNATLLFNRLSTDIYYALYLNPTLKTVPSCSIGWFENNATMKALYIRMMKQDGISEQELAKLAHYVGAEYYIHILANKNQKLSFEKLRQVGIVPLHIQNNKIIFQIKEP